MGWWLQLHATWTLVVMGPGSRSLRFACPGRRGFVPEFFDSFSTSKEGLNRHCERSEAIHSQNSGGNGLLRGFAPRNDEALISALSAGNSLSSFAVDELHQAVLLRLLQASSFCFQVVDLLCGCRHGGGGDIVAVDDVLEREHEFAIHHPVAAEFRDQNRDIICVAAIILGARRQNYV